MRLAVIGSGYVGLVAGTCFADSGNDVVCVDSDARKIRTLEAGQIPIYEPGLEELVERNVAAGRLRFSTELAPAVKAAQVVFIAVGTPEGETGEADLSYVLAAARDIARAMERYTIVVDKSTVPVGTAALVRREMEAITSVPFDVVSNPEFLKEGAAIDDFMKPDRVVLGVESERAREIMRELYAPFCRTDHPILFMDPKSAELTKYAANSMLAVRISFMNEIALLCERVGADVDLVRKGIGTDSRIGMPFLFPGTGWGGSCLAPEEELTVRRHGVVERTGFEALWTTVAAKARGTEAKAYAELSGVEVAAWTPGTGAVEFLPATIATRREYAGEMLLVEVDGGPTVRCTPDHPFVVASGAGTTVLPADRLEIGKRVPVAGIGGRVEWREVRAMGRGAFSGFVYSLEVPGPHTFVTTGGLVVHNCFPKDVKALYTTGRENGVELSIVRAADVSNENQKRLLLKKALKHFDGRLDGKTVAVWGLSFKPKTDDMREAPSIVLVEGLLGKGARVQAHDPVAHDTAHRVFGDRIVYAPTPYAALEGADALFVVTEWMDFRFPDFDRMKQAMKSPVVFDGRNLWEPAKMRERGFSYFAIGRP
jgi:UDP-glucose 6-dehydrogenase